jgi:hypothetical protein
MGRPAVPGGIRARRNRPACSRIGLAVVAIDSTLRRAALATMGMWSPCVVLGAWSSGLPGALVGFVGIIITWIAVRVAARGDETDRRVAIATALWAAPCASVGVAAAMLLASESMRGRLGASAAIYLVGIMLLAAGTARLARRLALGRVVEPPSTIRRRPPPLATILALVVVGVVAFDVLTGITMSTECVVDGTCEVGIPLRIEGSVSSRLLAFTFDLAVFLLPGVWLAALRSPVARRRAIGRIGLLVTAALIGTAIMASSPKWFGHRVWTGDRVGLVLGR